MTSPQTPFAVRPLTDHDLDAVVALNTAAMPAVPYTDREAMAALIGHASLALGVVDAERDGRVVGFVVAIEPGRDYEGEVYRAFADRGVDGFYVDRIVLGEGYRGRGLGPLLYDAVFRGAAEQGRAEVQCEVNVDPPNPGSLAFHGRLGFREIGRQDTKGGSVVVALLTAEVAA